MMQRHRAGIVETGRRAQVSRYRLVTERTAVVYGSLICVILAASTAAGQTPGTRPAPPLPVVIVPLPSAAPKTAVPPAPPPDVWSASEIADAKRVCQEALKSMTAAIVPLPPVKKGRCGAPAPVRLVSIGKKNPVKFVPAPTISCGMLVPLRRWIDKGLQRRAARYLDTRVTEVSVMSSYSCRTRYGRKGAKMSEHAFANALDIGGFRLADGTRVSVLKDWGPTRRDIAAQVAKHKAALAAKQKAAAAKSVAAATAKTNPESKPKTKPETNLGWNSSTRSNAKHPGAALAPVRIRQPGHSQQDQTQATARLQLEQSTRTTRPSKPTTQQQTARVPRPVPSPQTSDAPFERAIQSAMPPLPTRRPLRQAVRRRIGPNQTGVPQPEQKHRARPVPPQRQFTKPPYRLGGPKPPASAPRARFLRGIHQSACRIFGTTLGPEANEAHRNHFHFDMFPRRNRGYCE